MKSRGSRSWEYFDSTCAPGVVSATIGESPGPAVCTYVRRNRVYCPGRRPGDQPREGEQASMADHTRVDPCRILARGQLIGKFFILVGNAVPTVDRADPVGSALPVFLSELRLALDKPNFVSQIFGIAEE